jgi:type III pantothenate kinase
MNIAVDIGNSWTKIGIFNESVKSEVLRVGNSTISDHITRIAEDLPAPCRFVISAVGVDNRLASRLTELSDTDPLYVTASVNLPFTIGYKTPETLGSDRIAAIAGAYNMFPGLNVLVVDAGTAITYDILRHDKVWPGGSISPGLKTRFMSLNTFTEKLPLAESSKTWEITGNDTVSAIISGVQSGLIFEINEYIRTFKIRYKELKVLVTGGDGSFLADNLSYETTVAPDLVLEGLNHILNYNVK